jgi:hypothetical protein
MGDLAPLGRSVVGAWYEDCRDAPPRVAIQSGTRPIEINGIQVQLKP